MERSSLHSDRSRRAHFFAMKFAASRRRLGTTPAPVASVTTHMQLLRDPASLPGEHPWYLYESTATHMGDGHSDIQGRLWHEDGGLCGLITQHIADFSSSTRA